LRRGPHQDRDRPTSPPPAWPHQRSHSLTVIASSSQLPLQQRSPRPALPSSVSTSGPLELGLIRAGSGSPRNGGRTPPLDGGIGYRQVPDRVRGRPSWASGRPA